MELLPKPSLGQGQGVLSRCKGFWGQIWGQNVLQGHEKGQVVFRYSLIFSVIKEANLLDYM
ncbi:protein of unknown function [Enterobacter cancerogenus]|nr:protein of unknown function [Enterobacter cancerogenus]